MTIEEMCEKKSMRMTDQRRVIAKILDNATFLSKKSFLNFSVTCLPNGPFLMIMLLFK